MGDLRVLIQVDQRNLEHQAASAKRRLDYGLVRYLANPRGPSPDGRLDLISAAPRKRGTKVNIVADGSGGTIRQEA